MDDMTQLLSATKGYTLRDPKDYELAIMGAITSYDKAAGIINMNLTTDASLAVLLKSGYAAESSEFQLVTIPAMQEKMFENYAALKLGTELAASTVVNAGATTWVDTVTTPSLTASTYYFVIITLAAAQTLSFTQMSAVCPTTLLLAAGTHGLILLKDGQTEAATIICTPVVASDAGDSGILAANVANRVRIFPVEEFKAGDFGLIN